MTALSIAIPIAASLFWLWVITRHDDHEREPWPLVALAIGLGALVTFGVLWTRPWLEHLLHPASAVVEAFVVTAAAEEAWKLLALVPLLALREVDEPLDGAIYGAAVGLGFAAAENLWLAGPTPDLWLQMQRGATASLLHAACTGCLGLCFAEGKLRAPGAGTAGWLALGVVVAVAAHGGYDLFLDGDRARALLSLLVVLPLALALLAAKVRWARSRSHEFHPPADPPATNG